MPSEVFGIAGDESVVMSDDFFDKHPVFGAQPTSISCAGRFETCLISYPDQAWRQTLVDEQAPVHCLSDK